MRNNITYIGLEDLYLDRENPRLPKGIKINNDVEKDIINWMLEDASIIELMLAIGQSGFFVGEALLVTKNADEKYVVVEGNRRLTALKLLNNPELASVQKKRIHGVLNEIEYKPTEIPCIIFETRSEILKYLGFRHVTGVKSWGALAKARYLNSLYNSLNQPENSIKFKELAKSIGSRSDHVRKLLISYWIYETIEDNNFFKIKDLDETSFYFNYLTDSLSKDNIREFICVDTSIDEPLQELNQKNLEILIHWFFEKTENGRSRVLGNSEQLGMLNDILESKDATKYFTEGLGNIKQTHSRFRANADSFHGELISSLECIKRAFEYINSVNVHHDSDLTTLKEIYMTSKSMKGIIEGKRSDDWDN